MSNVILQIIYISYVFLNIELDIIIYSMNIFAKFISMLIYLEMSVAVGNFDSHLQFKWL